MKGVASEQVPCGQRVARQGPFLSTGDPLPCSRGPFSPSLRKQAGGDRAPSDPSTLSITKHKPARAAWTRGLGPRPPAQLGRGARGPTASGGKCDHRPLTEGSRVLGQRPPALASLGPGLDWGARPGPHSPPHRAPTPGLHQGHTSPVYRDGHRPASPPRVHPASAGLPQPEPRPGEEPFEGLEQPRPSVRLWRRGGHVAQPWPSGSPFPRSQGLVGGGANRSTGARPCGLLG